MADNLEKSKTEEEKTTKSESSGAEQSWLSASSLPGLSQEAKKAEIVIYTIPKRFLGVASTGGKNARGIGIMIISFGAIILIVALVFIYFYFVKFKKELLSGSVNIPQSVEISATTPEKDNYSLKSLGKKEKNKSPAESKIEADKEAKKQDEKNLKRIKVATSTVSTGTSTAAVQATSTKKEGAIATSTNPKMFLPAPDADNDFLTNAEEVILGTNQNLADTDGDGYLDGKELANLYNPAGNGKIIVNLNIKKYTNSIYHYSFYYPAKWQIETMGGLNSVMFKINNGQFIQVITEENSKKKSVEEWYKQETRAKFIKTDQKIYKSGWNGVRSEDGLTVYLKNSASDYIFVLTYNIGLETSLAYEHIFKMMVDSFSL